MEENGQINTVSGESTMNYSQGNFNTKKKGNKFFWLIPVILILVIVGVAVGGYIYYTKPEQFYKRLIASAIDSIEAQSGESDSETQKQTMKLDVELKMEQDGLIDEEILNLINDLELEIQTQIDKPQKQLVVGLQSEYENQSLLDLKVLADSGNKETYLYAKDFIDKYLEVELEDEIYSSIDELFETEEMSLGEKHNFKKGLDIFKKEYTNIVKTEYCSAEKATVKINDKEVNTTKNTIKMTLQQMNDGLSTAFDNLKQNEEFLSLLEEDYRDDMKEFLEDSQEELKNAIKGNEDAFIQVNIYTTGLTQKIVKVDIIVLDEDEKKLMTIACTKLDDQNYSFELSSDGEDLVKGSVKLEDDNTIELEAKIEELGSIAFNIEYNQKNDISVDQVDKDNISTLDNLTQQEQMDFLQNLQKSKLYELIEEFSNKYSSLDTTVDNSSSTIIDEGNDNENNNQLGGSTTTSALQDNQIVSYDDKTMISFGVPTGYTSYRVSDNFQSFSKNFISINVSTSYSTEDEYYNSLNDTKEYLTQSSYNKNITLSDKKNVTVGGKTFYHSTLKYDYVYSNGDTYTTNKDYFWTKVSADYIVYFEISELEEMTQNELEQLLTINVTNN